MANITPNCQCENCQKEWNSEELKPVSHIFERVMPGERMPAGECPDCGAVCLLKSIPKDRYCAIISDAGSWAVLDTDQGSCLFNSIHDLMECAEKTWSNLENGEEILIFSLEQVMVAKTTIVRKEGRARIDG